MIFKNKIKKLSNHLQTFFTNLKIKDHTEYFIKELEFSCFKYTYKQNTDIHKIKPLLNFNIK